MKKQVTVHHLSDAASQKNNQRGFTLMEMLIVVTIIGILAAIVIPRFVTSSRDAKIAAYEAERQMINTQIELFYFEHGNYPSEMTNSGWGTSFIDYFPDGVPTSSPLGITWQITNGRIVEQSAP